MYSYIPQLMSTAPQLWLLVVDCPLSALFFAIFLMGFNNKYFEVLARLSAFKYGVWTVVVTLTQPILMVQLLPAIFNIIMHLGLLIESFLFIEGDFLMKHIIPLIIFFLANDFSDYFLNTHPFIDVSLLITTGIFTFIMSFVTVLIFSRILLKK